MNTIALAVGTYMLLAFAGGALLGWIAGSARVPKKAMEENPSPSPGPTPYDLEEMVNQVIDDAINDPEPEPKPESYTLSGIIRDPLTDRFVKRDTNSK